MKRIYLFLLQGYHKISIRTIIRKVGKVNPVQTDVQMSSLDKNGFNYYESKELFRFVFSNFTRGVFLFENSNFKNHGEL